VAELGWRAFFRHRWAHLGTDILRDIHPGPRPAGDYARELPADIREGRTGVPAVDQAVRTLLRTGGLHNHARMWLASYVVHVRGVHWRAGADWMIGWLLDGDLASNHLSWQWIAGTGSHQPYLFNADNVAKYAPREWHSRGTVIDTSYEQLGEWAAGRGRSGVAGLAGPDPVRAAFAGAPVEAGGLSAEPPPGLDWRAPDAADVAGRTVWLVSPWSLGAPPPGLPADAVRVALWWTAWHEAWPWSAQRRAWVGAAWREVVGEGPAWAGDAAAVAEALRAARAVVAWDEPHWRAGLPLRPGARSATAAWPVRWVNPPDLFGAEPRPCKSFSAWWHKRMDPVKRLEDLPGWP
jgi:deoxyribodipyrimidine photo-lyase